MEIEDAGEHGAVRFIEGTVRARLHHEQAQLFWRVDVIALGGRPHAAEAQYSVGRAVEQRDRWGHQ